MNYFNVPPKQNNTYKSLADTYTQAKQLHEDVQILGIQSGGEQEDLGSIPDDYYKRLKRLVLAKSEGGTEAMVKQLLRLSQWEEVAEIDTIVLDIFLDYDIDVQVLNQIVEKKRAGTLGSFEAALSKKTEWSLESVLDRKITKLTDKWKELFGRLTRNVSPKINNVSVGPGEISLTMFTNATKGTTGDLQVGGMEVEIKGAGGRLGSSDYTKEIITTPGNKYLNILSPMGKHFSQYENQAIIQSAGIKASVAKDKMNNVQNNMYKSLASLSKSGMLDDTVYEQATESLEGIFKQMNDNLTIVDENRFTAGDKTNKPSDVVNNLKIALQALDTKAEELFPGVTVVTKTARENYNSAIQKIESLESINMGKTNYNWQDSTQYMFNYEWELTPRQLAEAFVEMRTEPMDSGSVASMITVAEKWFSKKDLRDSLLSQMPGGTKGRKSTGQVTLQRLQTALMAVSYQSVHGFERLMIINPKQKNLKAIFLHFDNNLDAGSQLNEIYKQLNKNPSIVVQNAGVDTRNKGIGISLV